MTIDDMLEYYAIAKDSKNIKRVEELANLRDEAVADGNDSKSAVIDCELTNMEGVQ